MVIVKIAKGAKALTKRVKVRKVTGKPRGKAVINTRPKFVDKIGKKIGSKIRKKSATGDFFSKKRTKPLGQYHGFGSQKELDAVRWNQRGQHRVMLAQDRQTRIHKLIRKDKKVLPPYAFKKFTTKRKLSLPSRTFLPDHPGTWQGRGIYPHDTNQYTTDRFHLLRITLDKGERPGAWFRNASGRKRSVGYKKNLGRVRGEDLAIGASGAVVFGGIGGVALSRYHGKTLTGADLPKKKKKKGSKQ